METKFCHKCQLEKPVCDWYKNKSKIDGLSTECKTCSQNRNKKWRTNNTQRLYDNYKKWKKNNQNKIVQGNLDRIQNLSDSYIRQKLRKKGFSKKDCRNVELIEVQRLLIKTQRLWKTSENSEKA